MIRLYDWLNKETKDLDYTLDQAGFSGQAVVINDDGFLPDNMTSPYSYFCGLEEAQSGRSLYFNEVPVPEFWQITGTNSTGEVWEMDQKRATIFYVDPKHERRVKNVDWYDRSGRVRFTDHYNKYGWLFARTTFNTEKKVSVKTYYNRQGQEIITENYQTGSIILNWENRIHFFQSRVAFITHYFKTIGLDTSQVWYNSLSTPFFLSRYLEAQGGQDILFWQEDIADSIPGNMQVIFDNPNGRTKRIVVQKKAAYDKLMTLLPDEQKERVVYLDYIYPNYPKTNYGKNILIMTNSDQIEQLQTLVDSLPDYHFQILALTEMSSRLMAFGDYEHVSLYPNVTANQALDLVKQADIYLDINHGNEILDAVRTAYEHNLILFAFDNTIHQADLIAKESVFVPADVAQMIERIKAVANDAGEFLAKQRPVDKETISQHYHSYLD